MQSGLILALTTSARWSLAAAQCLDIKSDCGARGDGHGDDTAAFQKCVATAHCCGGCVRVSVGTYPLTSVAINVSDIALLIDAGTELRTPTGYESGPAGSGIFAIGADDATPAHNVSVVGVGGQFVIDCTRQAVIGTNRVAALRLKGNVKNFAIGNIRTKMAFGPITASSSQDLNTNAIAMGNVLVDDTSYHPTNGHVYNITNSGSWGRFIACYAKFTAPAFHRMCASSCATTIGGYGLVQVQSAENVLFEHLESTVSTRNEGLA
jgi:hypothetical protein|eukprot:COSAG02_NODE_6858_length_3324_cov_1.822016_3_plen_265_part_00